jgi:hypothetical protein
VDVRQLWLTGIGQQERPGWFEFLLRAPPARLSSDYTICAVPAQGCLLTSHYKYAFGAVREANLRAAGGDGASSPDAVARWLWEKIGKR